MNVLARPARVRATQEGWLVVIVGNANTKAREGSVLWVAAAMEEEGGKNGTGRGGEWAMGPWPTPGLGNERAKEVCVGCAAPGRLTRGGRWR